MLLRFLLALVLGAVLGVERELVGIGMERLAITAALLVALLLFVLRKTSISERLGRESKELG